MKKFLLSIAIVAISMGSVMAQENSAEKLRWKGIMNNSFWSNWELSLGGGVNYTAWNNAGFEAQGDFADNLGWQAELGVTKWFNPIVGTRLQVVGGKLNPSTETETFGSTWMLPHVDGIINLSSTTLGATGAAGDATLGDNYKQKNPSKEYPEYSYVSSDNMVDVSTAVLPDNTWVFLDQYHEVGDNDVVLNLAKALLLEEIDDVHSDPEKYPQFNNKVTTKYVRRWRLADAYEVDRTNLTADQIAKLDKAIADGEAVIYATVAPKQEDVDAADRALMEILHEIGYQGYENIEEEEDKAGPVFEKVLGGISWLFVEVFGSKSYVDFFIDLIAGAVKK